MIRAVIFDAFLRLIAGWDLRARQNDQWSSVIMMLVLALAPLAFVPLLGGDGDAWFISAILATVGPAAYLWGLWDDGGRALSERDH